MSDYLASPPYIWAIVAACVRPDSFYKNFPNA